MTRLLSELNWPTLEMRRKYLRPSMFNKILNDTIEVELPFYVKEQSRQSRSTAKKFITLPVSRDFYKFSFNLRTIIDWNSLPGYVRLANNGSVFKDISPCLIAACCTIIYIYTFIVITIYIFLLFSLIYIYI